MTSQASLARPLGAFEWAMWLSEQGVTNNCVIMGEVVGPLDERVLSDALAWTQGKYPPLRTCIRLDGQRPHFRATSATIPVRVSDGDWRSVAERELSTTLDVARGPLARCELVRRGPGRATLLLSFSHVAVDGYSMIAIFDDLLRAANAILANRPLEPAELPPSPPIEERLPAWLSDLRVVPGVARLLVRERLGLARRGSPQSFTGRQPPAARRVQLIARHLDTHLTEQVVSQSKRHEVPVQATLAAAQMLGIADEIGADVVPLWLGSSVDLRSKLNPPVTRRDEAGLFVSLLGSGLTVDRRLSLWSLARDWKRDQAARFAREEPLLTFPLGSRMFSVMRRFLPPDSLGGLRLVELMRKAFPAGTAISNLGNVTMTSPDDAALRLEALHFAATESVMPLTSTSLTYRGRLYWNFMNHAGEQGARVTERIVSRLCEATRAS